MKTMESSKAMIVGCVILILLVGTGGTVAFGGDNWPTWRGPGMKGIASGGDPPLKWSESENIKWKVKLTGDASNSSLVIWGDKIFFQTVIDTKIKDDTPTLAPAPTPRPGGRGGRPGGGVPGGPGGRPGGDERRGRGGRRPGGGSGLGGSVLARSASGKFFFDFV